MTADDAAECAANCQSFGGPGCSGVGFVAGGACNAGSCQTPTATPSVTATATATDTPIPNGGGCTEPSECESGNCEDAVCCDEECEGPLVACNLPGQVGTCSSIAAPAPTTSPRGLAVAIGLLVAVAALALAARRRLLEPRP
jgi:hypothetical protein